MKEVRGVVDAIGTANWCGLGPHRTEVTWSEDLQAVTLDGDEGYAVPEAAEADASLCPLRPGSSCSLCGPGASSPETCGLVYLVMTDPDLRAQLEQRRSQSLKSEDLK